MSPASVRASAAANWNVLTARSASTRAVLIGLAASTAMVRAKSSRRSARRAAASRISARRHAGSGPACERGLGGGDGPVDLGRAARRHRPDDRAVVGRLHLDDVVRTVKRSPARGRARTSVTGRPYCGHAPRRSPSWTGPGPSPFAHPGGGRRVPREHHAGVRGARSRSATATSRPTGRHLATACSSPSTTRPSTGITDHTGTIADLDLAEVEEAQVGGHRAHPPLRRGASRAGPTCASTSSRRPTEAVDPLDRGHPAHRQHRPDLRRVVLRRTDPPHPQGARPRAVHRRWAAVPTVLLRFASWGVPSSTRFVTRTDAACAQVPAEAEGRAHHRPALRRPLPTSSTCRCTSGRSTTPPR